MFIKKFKTQICLLINFLIINLMFKYSLAHGRLEIPASRNSAWRFGFKTPQNYNDNELNCGGAGQQHAVNGGRCGVCGDSYNGVRNHEVGGLYATGTLVNSYIMGQIIDVRVRLSANHKGTMEFRICPVEDEQVEVTHECLDQYLLEIIGYGTAYPVNSGESEINLNIKLPNELICSHCVFQWKYRAGNNWGSLPNGKSGIGIGPQEEFYNCADVEIRTNEFEYESTTTTEITTTTIKTTPKPIITTRLTTTKQTTLKTSQTETSILTNSTKTTTNNILTTLITKPITPVSSSKISFILSTKPNIVIQPFFHCEKIDKSIVDKLPKTPDPNEYNGVPLCLLIGDSQFTCKDCYENCISPMKQCPKQFCYCRWYV